MAQFLNEIKWDTAINFSDFEGSADGVRESEALEWAEATCANLNDEKS